MRSYLFVAFIGLAGCATTAPQATELLSEPGAIPKQAFVASVPFVQQEVGHCGPATLTMAMNWAGHPARVEDLAPKVMTSSKEGSLQQDMISAARREGLMAVRVDGFRSLMSELADGNPVIIFENLGLSWYQQWHYAIAIGYDLDRREVVLHSGSNREERTDMKVFERSWKHSNYWAIAVLPVDRVARSAGELENTRAAAGLELAQHSVKAEQAYRTILARWPDGLSARIGLANLAYARKDFRAAVATLEEASKLHPNSEIVKHNLTNARRALVSKEIH